MNDDDLTLLASSYLDGDVTADERARVEGDPVALAEVDRLRSVRALLGDVEPPAISIREAQLAAALDIWDRLPERERTGARRDATPVGIDAAAAAGAAAVTAPTPLHGRRRPGRTTSTRWLTGAAAALVLVLAGGVALQLSSTDSDDSAESSTTEAAESVDALVATEGDADDLAAESAPAGALADEAPAPVDTRVDPDVEDVAPPGENAGLAQLDDLDDLADFAAVAIGAPRAPEDVTAATSATDGDESATELPRCLGVDLVVGPAVYGDVAVVVGIDEGRDLAIAYVPDTCAEVARVRLP
jgi:hypothetical protein